jgi:hypothetical protein
MPKARHLGQEQDHSSRTCVYKLTGGSGTMLPGWTAAETCRHPRRRHANSTPWTCLATHPLRSSLLLHPEVVPETSGVNNNNNTNTEQPAHTLPFKPNAHPCPSQPRTAENTGTAPKAPVHAPCSQYVCMSHSSLALHPRACCPPFGRLRFVCATTGAP